MEAREETFPESPQLKGQKVPWSRDLIHPHLGSRLSLISTVLKFLLLDLKGPSRGHLPAWRSA